MILKASNNKVSGKKVSLLIEFLAGILIINN